MLTSYLEDATKSVHCSRLTDYVADYIKTIFKIPETAELRIQELNLKDSELKFRGILYTKGEEEDEEGIEVKGSLRGQELKEINSVYETFIDALIDSVIKYVPLYPTKKELIAGLYILDAILGGIKLPFEEYSERYSHYTTQQLLDELEKKSQKYGSPQNLEYLKTRAAEMLTARSLPRRKKIDVGTCDKLCGEPLEKIVKKLISL